MKEEEAKAEGDEKPTDLAIGAVEAETGPVTGEPNQEGLRTETVAGDSQTVTVKQETAEEGGLSKPQSSPVGQGGKRKMSDSPPSLGKRAKVEPDEVEDWDDGGIADDDLVGLI